MRTVHWVGVVALCGCVAGDEPGDQVDDDFAAGKGDGTLDEGSPGACAALGAANTASLAELDDDAGLAASAARSIVEHRPFADLAALDAAPWVGPVALEHLVAYGEGLGLLLPAPGLIAKQPPGPASDDCLRCYPGRSSPSPRTGVDRFSPHPSAPFSPHRG